MKSTYWLHFEIKGADDFAALVDLLSKHVVADALAEYAHLLRLL